MTRRLRVRWACVSWVCFLLVAGYSTAIAQENAAETDSQVTAEASAEPPATVEAEPGDAAESDAPGWYFFLYAKEEYRFRYTGEIDQQDHDLRLALDFLAEDPSRRWGVDVSLALYGDVNGDTTSAAQYDNYTSPNDRDSNLLVHVYRLSAEYHSPGVLKLVRAGRQVTEIGSPVTFDGATVQVQAIPKHLQISVFGGRTAHFFELGQEVFEDWIASGALTVRPIRDLKLELDYRFLYEDRRFADFDPQSPAANQNPDHVNTIKNHTLGMQGWYRYQDWFHLNAFARTIDDQLAYLGGATKFEWYEHEVGFELRTKAQMVSLDEVAESIDPSLAILGISKPNVHFSGDIWKSFTTAVGVYGLHLGYQGRMLIKGEDEDVFNRNVGRVYAMFTATDIGVKGPFLTLSFERWADDVELNADGLWSVGGSAGYDHERFRAEAGSFYQRYKYTYYRDSREVADVRTYYLDVSGKPLPWLKMSLRYEFEQYEFDAHTVLFGLSQTY